VHDVEVDGSAWASGTYICRLTTDGAAHDHTMTLVR
jgi:hypothetical protein